MTDTSQNEDSPFPLTDELRNQRRQVTQAVKRLQARAEQQESEQEDEETDLVRTFTIADTAFLDT